MVTCEMLEILLEESCSSSNNILGGISCSWRAGKKRTGNQISKSIPAPNLYRMVGFLIFLIEHELKNRNPVPVYVRSGTIF